ncbi:MAG: hypothetical protein RR998_05185 [Oscillospiraceae bacterium]
MFQNHAGTPLEGEVRISSGCAIAAIFRRDGSVESGRRIVDSISALRERSNGLGGGFAAYGIYPHCSELYALHVFCDGESARTDFESILRTDFTIELAEPIPTVKCAAISKRPLTRRYFVLPRPDRLAESGLDEESFVVRFVIGENAETNGILIFSCGKNMGVFKAEGYPEDVGEFYDLERYSGYCWTAHGRYPTNTPGWWGGAHPFSLLGLSVVHNGEISSYEVNRHCVESRGYHCALLTDTEVITYIFDFLTRRTGLSLREASGVIAAPFWSELEALPEPERSRARYLRYAFPGLLINGPFSIIVGFDGGLMLLSDRLKLRSTVYAEQAGVFYAASEECAIRAIAPSVGNIRAPRAGDAIITTLNGSVNP